MRDLEVEALLARAEGLVSRVMIEVELKPRDLVVLTEMSEAREARKARKAREHGPVVGEGVLG